MAFSIRLPSTVTQASGESQEVPALRTLSRSSVSRIPSSLALLVLPTSRAASTAAARAKAARMPRRAARAVFTSAPWGIRAYILGAFRFR